MHLKNVKEAIDLHIECLREDGEEILHEESYKVAVESG
jgi:predicted RNase H-like HicB family nuclease